MKLIEAWLAGPGRDLLRVRPSRGLLRLPTGRGELATSDESLEVGFFTTGEIEAMAVHESIRLRIRHYLEHRPEPVIA